MLGRLKEATSQAHHRVEEAVERLGPIRERAGYARYLGRLFGFYQPLEPLLEQQLGGIEGLDLEARRKTPLIERDLVWLGIDSRALPRCDELPRLATRAAALGGLYVVEGATLGGRALLRRLGEALGASPTAGAAFLGCYGEALSARWQAVRTVIATAAVEQALVGPILDGAAATFEALDRWLRRP